MPKGKNYLAMTHDLGRGTFEKTSGSRRGTRKCSHCGLDVSATQSACPVDGTAIEPLVHTGSTLDGKYEFLSLIGSGGMGVIYKARQIVLNKTVAIKMLHSELVNERALRRFRREGKAASALSHPNIIAVHDFAVSEHGQPYMVMDYVEGKTLEDMIQDIGCLEIDYTVDAMIQICDALSHAHKNGVLHRDMKPSNVLVVDNGPDKKPTMLILDFGIAKIIDPDSNTASLTQTGDTLGSPLYMSPEQCNGVEIDQRTELYNLGCTMYECLTGLPPFVGATLANIIVKISNEPPPPMKDASLGMDYPHQLEAIVMKLLSKKPEDRYQTADDLRQALINFRQGVPEPVPVARLDVQRLAKEKPKASKAVIAISSAATVLALGLVSFTAYKFTHKALPVVKTSVASAQAPVTDNSASTTAVHEMKISTAVRNWVDKNPSAATINLGYWEISDDDMPPLAEETACMELGLPGNSIKGPGLKYIEPMKMLNSLRLDKNDLGDDALVHLSGMTSLNRLNLNLTHVNGAGLAYLKNCPIAFLDLAHTKIAAATLAPLEGLVHLGSLNVDDTLFDNACIKYLMPLKELKVVDLSHTQVSGKGIAELAKHPQICELWLTGTPVDDDCMKELAKMPGLVKLDISGTPVTAAGILHLRNAKQLNTIYCGGCKGDLIAAFAEIKKTLPNCILVPQTRRGQ